MTNRSLPTLKPVTAPFGAKRLPLILCIVAALPLAGCLDDETAGGVAAVKAVKPEAEIVSGYKQQAAAPGANVKPLDELVTRREGRMAVTFIDDSRLTLGPEAKLTIASFVYDPALTGGEAQLRSIQGPFHFVRGKLDGKDRIGIVTPVANVSLRGSEIWAGPIDGTYAVLLLGGEVIVENGGGSVTLSKPGQGTEIASATEPPSSPKTWPKDRVARAMKTVSLPRSD